MSRFFKYKHAADLERDARARGLPIALADDLAPLLRPLCMGSHTLGNRLAVQPMEGCDADLDGTPGELTLRRFRRFGAGGAKLIWGEACAVVPEGRANPRQLLINEANVGALERMRAACVDAHREAFGHSSQLLVGLQLTHSGRYSHAQPLLAQHDPLLAPLTRGNARMLNDDELLRLQDHFVDAAKLAARAGFDFIDLKQCHRYLLSELLAARARPGRFGGSFENRTRFATEVIARIRDACPGLIVATRLNVFDGLPFVKGADGNGVAVKHEAPVTTCWGTNSDDPNALDLEEPLRYVARLVQLGVSLVGVTMGNPYASPHILRPFEYPPPDGYESPEHPLVGVARHFQAAETVQRAYPQLVVVGSGYSWLQEFVLRAAAANVAEGRVSVVGLGRASLSQPDFAARLMRGESLDRKRVCRTFSYCTALMRSKHNELGQFATGCPPFDKDVYGPIWQQANDSGK